MRKHLTLVVVFLLSLTLMACGATGSSPSASSSGGSSSSSSSAPRMVRDLLVTSDAYEVVDAEMMGSASVVYKTKLTTQEAFDFYKTEMATMNYTVRQEANTAHGASILFDGSKQVTVGIAPDPAGSGATVVTITAMP
jgi:hypothetical protein